MFLIASQVSFASRVSSVKAVHNIAILRYGLFNLINHVSEMDSSDEEEAQIALMVGLLLRRRIRRSRVNRTMWIRPILQMRSRQGVSHNLLQEMRLTDPEKHFNYLRMTKETFDVLLRKVPLMNSSTHIHTPMFFYFLFHRFLHLCIIDVIATN